METLTDRYVWAVTRGVPHQRRTIIDEQLRAAIANGVADRRAAGDDPTAAETSVIAELGDPDRRAADYAGRQPYLIEPAYFFDYRRTMIVVLSAVAPSVFGALLLVHALAGTDLWTALSSALSVAVTVSVQVAFWMTGAFALIDRLTHGRRRTQRTWDPRDLPEVPTTRVGLGETIFALLAYLLFIGLLVWQHNIWVVESAGGTPVPVLDPGLWTFWLPWFIAVAILEMGFALALYAVGRWTWVLAGINLVLALAFAVPAIVLLATDRVLSATFRDVFAEIMPLVQALLWLLPLIVAGVALLDIEEGFRKAYRARSVPAPPGGGSAAAGGDRRPRRRAVRRAHRLLRACVPGIG